VLFDHRAAREFEGVKGKADRKAVFTAVEKLFALGPALPSPHIKSLKNAPVLWELRPRQGRCAVRPIYTRIDDRFVILAVAADKPSFDAALLAAGKRASEHQT
jgi:hypothetical protein